MRVWTSMTTQVNREFKHQPRVGQDGRRPITHRRGNRSQDALIHKVCSELEHVYGCPRHGNKANPLDELIYIILSTRTRDRSFQSTFRRLKREFPAWSNVRRRDRSRMEAVLKPAGLA